MLRSLHCMVLVFGSAASLSGCFLDRSAIAAGEDASVGCGQCPPGEECVDGVCRSTTVDRDEDGVPAGDDCDDDDAEIGSSYERSCSGLCGTGLERCVNGEWAACNAPTECDCMPPSSTREIVCSMCGRQTQICQDRQWTDQGTCTGMGECVAGAVETDASMACGLCGEGTQTRTRTCSDTCAWGDWSEWGACMGESAECPAGLDEVENQPCGTSCGTQTRTRTCSATCGWGAWSEWTECVTPADACVPAEVETQRENCPCGSGASTQRTRTRTCDAACGWSAWTEWTACASGECTAGATETGTPTECGSCGAQTPTRTCTSECTWGDWTPGTCTETRCTGTCACGRFLGWTCCPTGDWSGWNAGCGGC